MQYINATFFGVVSVPPVALTVTEAAVLPIEIPVPLAELLPPAVESLTPTPVPDAPVEMEVLTTVYP